MTKATIRETTVLPDERGAVVRLQVSDAPLHVEDAAIRLILTVRVPAYQAPALAHLQREAIKIADNSLRALLQDLATELNDARYNLEPVPVRS